MGSGFLFEGGKAFSEEVILVTEGLDFVAKGGEGFGFGHDVMEWKAGWTRTRRESWRVGFSHHTSTWVLEEDSEMMDEG